MIIVDKEGKLIQRLASVSRRGKEIKEDLLQKLIFNYPNILPISEIDSVYSKLIPLKREFPVKSGYIDVLCLTHEGILCIIETKLWRNPEAHRTVVAQILDYATDLTKLSFLEFCELITNKKGEGAIHSFFDIVKKNVKVDDVELQNEIQYNLANGKFLLLIVGDRIYSEVAFLTEAIQSAPHLEFSIALVELRFFTLDQKYLVVPSIVSKTKEVTRAVVKIRYEKAKPDVEVTAFEDIETPRGKTDLREFISQMLEGFADIFLPFFERWEKEDYTIVWGTVGLSIRVLQDNRLKTILEIAPHYSSIYSKKWENSRKLPSHICEEFRQRVIKNPVIRRMLNEKRSYIYYKDLTLEDFSYLLNETNKTMTEMSLHYKHT